MGISERKDRERTGRKVLIMRCAKALIMEHGADRVSMMDIAKKAELSKATLYLYFSSKDVLFRDICEAAGEQFIAYFQSRMPHDGLPALDSLKLLWQCFLDVFGASDDILIFFSMKRYLAPEFSFIPIEEGASPPGDSSYLFYKMIQEIIAQGEAEGFYEPGIDSGMVARTILALFSSMVENTVKLPPGLRNYWSVIEELRGILEILLRGIAREGLDRSCLSLPKQRVIHHTGMAARRIDAAAM